MNVKVIHVKMVAPAQTWKMDMTVHVKVDLLGLNVKQVIFEYIEYITHESNPWCQTCV